MIIYVRLIKDYLEHREKEENKVVLYMWQLQIKIQFRCDKVPNIEPLHPFKAHLININNLNLSITKEK
jgi:hypothetical protein